jgi:hypothetical protein
MANSDDGGETVRAAVYLGAAHERELAERVLGSLEPDGGDAFSGVFEGSLEPEQVKRLHDAGLVVELIKPPGAEVPEPLGGPVRQLADSAEVIDELKGHAEIERPGGLTPSEEEALPEDVYNVRLHGPITREQRLELDGIGVDLAAFEPRFGYRTFLTREQYAAVSKLPYVAEVTRYRFVQSVTPELLDTVTEEGEGGEGPELLSGGEEGAPEEQLFDCLLHREEDLAQVRELIEKTPQAEVVDSSNLRVRFSAGAHVPLLASLAAMPEVRKLSPYEAPTI